MGNALVVGIIEKIASTLKNELKNNNFRQKWQKYALFVIFF
jgi:hypothetical protein